MKMFRRKRVSPPSTPFAHGPDCRIFAADPGVDIPWNDLGGGAWRRECVCSFEIFNTPFVDERIRLDPYDPATARHLPHCEYIDEVSPAVLKILLTVKPGLAPGYDWVTCAGCEGSWQVPHFAAERAGTG